MTHLLILSSNTGEGHNSAAAAIEYAAHSAGLDVLVRKPLEESGKLNRWFAGLYNVLLTRRPGCVPNTFGSSIGWVRTNEIRFTLKFGHSSADSYRLQIPTSSCPFTPCSTILSSALLRKSGATYLATRF